MASPEHIAIVKAGRIILQQWRDRHPSIRLDLANSNLAFVDLASADLRGADLGNSVLIGSDLQDSDLSAANLSDADLSGANLAAANLSDADFSRADLRNVNLGSAVVAAAVFSEAIFGGTTLVDIDPSEALHLETAHHLGHSELSGNALSKSQGKIPELFLRGCGLADWEIAAVKLYDSQLTESQIAEILYEIGRLRGEKPPQISPVFLAYSHADSEFVEALETKLDSMGIRYWRDAHDLRAGRLEAQIDRAIRLNPTIILVLSRDSVKSDWLEWEVVQARQIEKETGRAILCPIALDDAWKTTGWPREMRRHIQDYNILDFSSWREEEILNRQFQRLLDGLKVFYTET